MQVSWKPIYILLSLFTAVSCVTTTVVVNQPDTVPLIKAGKPANPPLNISIVAFNAGIGNKSASSDTSKIFLPLRTAEAGYLPFVLREALVESGHWGAVRVVPELDPTAEILVTAEILTSNGIELKLRVKAWDSTGRSWIDGVYEVSAIDHGYDFEADSLVEPFQDLFNKIANDIYMVRQEQTTKTLSNILDTSMLRYAVALSPKAFGEYLEINEDGMIEMSGLPARNDLMYARAKKIRDSEYEFIDIVDEQFENFYKRMRQTYSYWRQYSYELLAYNRRIEQADTAVRRHHQGSWAALDDVYKAYKDSKMNEDELRELAASFDAEITPTVTMLEGTVVKLTGSLRSQYEEWRELLQEIYTSERGEN